MSRSVACCPSSGCRRSSSSAPPPAASILRGLELLVPWSSALRREKREQHTVVRLRAEAPALRRSCCTAVGLKPPRDGLRRARALTWA
jgi:hypothetical protein